MLSVEDQKFRLYSDANEFHIVLDSLTHQNYANLNVINKKYYFDEIGMNAF